MTTQTLIPLCADILSTEELAAILRCSAFTIEEKARRGELPGLKFGDGGWVFPWVATLGYLNTLATQRPDMSPAKVPLAIKVPLARSGPPVLPQLPKDWDNKPNTKAKQAHLSPKSMTS